MSDKFTLKKLEKIIGQRSKATVDKSHTARLLARGALKCGEKFGEEAIELIVASAAKEQKHMKEEAADVLYHFLVLLRSREVRFQEVLDVLEARTAQSGIAEKAARTKK